MTNRSRLILASLVTTTPWAMLWSIVYALEGRPVYSLLHLGTAIFGAYSIIGLVASRGPK